MIEFKLLLMLLVANGAPILARNLLKSRFTIALDGGRQTSSGRFWLGPSKTLRGLIAAILAAMLAAPLLGFSWELGFTVGVLAMLGDLLASFIKRRMGLASSAQAPGLDQIPESLIPMLYCTYKLDLDWPSLMIVVMSFWVMEILLSRLLFRWGIRRHPY